MRHPHVLIATSLFCASCVSASSDANGTTGDGDSTGAGTTHSSTDTVGDAQTSAGISSDTTESPPATSSGSSAGDSTGTQTTGESSGESTGESSGESSGESTGESTGGSGPLDCPAPPPALQRWQVGNDDDVSVAASGPALVLMGGGPDVDSALEAALAFTAGGDVVVVRASGGDGYNDYFFSELGGVDSVETLLVDSAALAEDPYVACRVGAAELVWFAGGDQAEYMTFYANSALAAAVQAVHEGGGVVGGTSAGLAILGAHVFAAYEGTVYPDEVLEDPYNQYMELDAGPFSFAGLERVITDSHFYERDRMGRLIGFLARLVQDATATDPVGIGVDEATALLIGPEGTGTVYGDGFVYVLEAAGAPQVCQPGVALSYQGLQLWRLQSGDTVSLEPAVTASVSADVVGADAGALVPANPY